MLTALSATERGRESRTAASRRFSSWASAVAVCSTMQAWHNRDPSPSSQEARTSRRQPSHHIEGQLLMLIEAIAGDVGSPRPHRDRHDLGRDAVARRPVVLQFGMRDALTDA